MKTFIATVLLVAIASAEVPPSKGYLPPPSGRFNGYASGGPAVDNFAPEVVAARSLGGAHGAAGQGHGQGPAGFGGSGPQSHHARTGGAEGYEHNDSAFGRNALEDPHSEPANYNFGYMVNDHYEGTEFGHHEQRQEERAQGEYHVVLPDGRRQTVSYKADERGFKPQVSYEDSEDLGRSGGYDANGNNFNGGYDSNANSRSQHGNGFHGNGEHGNHGNDDHAHHGNGASGRSNGY